MKVQNTSNLKPKDFDPDSYNGPLMYFLECGHAEIPLHTEIKLYPNDKIACSECFKRTKVIDVAPLTINL